MIKIFSKYNGSEKFWNITLIIVAIIMPFISIYASIAGAAITSIMAFFMFIDEKKFQFGFIVSPLVWFFLIISFIYLIVDFIYDRLILPFNECLNKKIK